LLLLPPERIRSKAGGEALHMKNNQRDTVPQVVLDRPDRFPSLLNVTKAHR
jgi:hypothetical protein